MAELRGWRAPISNGWRIDVDEAWTFIDIIDAVGVTRARMACEPIPHYTGWGSKIQNRNTQRAYAASGPHLDGGRAPKVIHVVGGTGDGVLRPGANDGVRSTKNAHIELGGRRYTLKHTGTHTADVVRDDELVVKFVSRGFWLWRTQVREALAPLDMTDELALTLFERLIGAGRPGAVDDAITGLAAIG